MKKRKFKIGLIQISSKNGDTEVNLEKGIKMIKEAYQKGAEIVCLPELFYGGYFLNSTEMNNVAEKNNGPFVQTLSSLAKELGIYIIAGYAEATDIIGKIHNSAIFISEKGEVIGNMRKVYSWGEEKLKFRSGNKFPVYDTPLGKIGIMICYDAEYPEPARIMALKGADIIFVPSVWSVRAQPRWDIDLSANALFNLMFTVGVNTIGEGICGRSQVYGPDGILRARASGDKEEVVICEVDLNEIQKVRSEIPYFNDFIEDTFSMEAINEY